MKKSPALPILALSFLAACGGQSEETPRQDLIPISDIIGCGGQADRSPPQKILAINGIITFNRPFSNEPKDTYCLLVIQGFNIEKTFVRACLEIKESDLDGKDDKEVLKDALSNSGVGYPEDTKVENKALEGIKKFRRYHQNRNAQEPAPATEPNSP